MGIQIEIDLQAISKDSQGLSRKSWALGTIHYGEHETGQLLYIKSSLCGNENPYIQSYKMNHATFPHESTSNQFFDETQFEVYRALGYSIVNRLMREEPEIVKSLWPDLREQSQ
ncbi:MAG: hypothetical protein ETSY1_02085 [Candidatus Entotheonella factor]|uniref:Uncharacterized protein n=1 Tax=Entotheonella factor TaxID=1429438 RepID=W4LY98_ENTF1|nr:MAG: hypothetical protein ETSY1_02085 [Candidatus Entotheonella factor]